MANLRKIAVLGSTGSIGQNALQVIESIEDLRCVGLSGHSRLSLLWEQAAQFKPATVVAADSKLASQFDFETIDGVDWVSGSDALVKLATASDVDIVLAAIVGRAGLESSLAAVKAGKTLALANKETLVVAGQLVMESASEFGAMILPVDSEHSAVFQALKSGETQEVERIILTASGGPFRDLATEQLKYVTVEQAPDHPTWDMGKKISVDSATMMNKALEIIEARWLFDLSPEKIDVVIHPESIIHSLVEFVDGSVIAQMSPPDMKLPIQFALTYPERVPGLSPKLDFSESMNLRLDPPDLERFPALKLGFEVARSGGTSGAVLNAANEAAVQAFLEKTISFTDIVDSCREVLHAHNFEPRPTLEQLLDADLWARKEISKWITC